MKIIQEKVELKSEKSIDLIDVTNEVDDIVHKSGIKNGQVLVFSPHTTAGLTLNDSEPMLIQDLTRTLNKLIPIDERFDHDLFELSKNNKSDGRSNGHSQCKNLLLGSSEVIPILDSEIQLGEKQKIFFVELDGARERDFIVQIMGE
jgi:secondary thiamine-phosphate synthase enzyme